MKYDYFKVFKQKYVINLKIIRTNIHYLHDLHIFSKLIMNVNCLQIVHAKMCT